MLKDIIADSKLDRHLWSDTVAKKTPNATQTRALKHHSAKNLSRIWSDFIWKMVFSYKLITKQKIFSEEKISLGLERSMDEKDYKS